MESSLAIYRNLNRINLILGGLENIRLKKHILRDATTTNDESVIIFSLATLPYTSYAVTFNVVGRNSSNDNANFQGNYLVKQNESNSSPDYSNLYGNSNEVDCSLNGVEITASSSSNMFSLHVHGKSNQYINWSAEFSYVDVLQTLD